MVSGVLHYSLHLFFSLSFLCYLSSSEIRKTSLLGFFMGGVFGVFFKAYP